MQYVDIADPFDSEFDADQLNDKEFFNQFKENLSSAGHPTQSQIAANQSKKTLKSL